ncbi:hypothetical protein Asp14428_17740 [Actinoplanes sp. NBRC 14428]|nr:hypothetical protein Asp14428_17740 [Actinoplanes sp. NBRC 14428]
MRRARSVRSDDSTSSLEAASMRPRPAATRSLARAVAASSSRSRACTASRAPAGTAGSRSRTLGHITTGVVAARARRTSVPDRTDLSMRTTGQKYEDLSPLRQVVPEASRSASDEFAVMARLPTKSCTCSAPFLMPGCATGLSGLNLPLALVPQSTVKRPREAPARFLGTVTLGCTASMGTNCRSSVAASAVPLPPPVTKVTVRAPVAASTAAAMPARAGRDRHGACRGRGSRTLVLLRIEASTASIGRRAAVRRPSRPWTGPAASVRRR